MCDMNSALAAKQGSPFAQPRAAIVVRLDARIAR